MENGTLYNGSTRLTTERDKEPLFNSQKKLDSASTCVQMETGTGSCLTMSTTS